MFDSAMAFSLLLSFYWYDDHRALHSFPTRRSSDLIDFGKPEGADLIKRLARRAHVVVENFKTGTLAKYGLDYESDRKSTRLNSSHMSISYAVFCLKKKKVLLVFGGWDAAEVVEDPS